MALTPEQRAEIERTIATNRATQNALTEDRVGDQAEMEIRLAQSSDDPPWQSPEYQRELREFAEALRGEGLEVSSRVRVHDAVDGGMWLLGEFIIKLAQAGVPAALATGAGAWLHARYGRKARLKIGDIEAEARSVEEIEKLINLADKHPRRRDDQ